MTDEQKRERLLTHPDTIEVEIGGEARPWLLGKYAIDLAKKQDVRLQDVLGGPEGPGDEEDIEAGFEQMCRLLWMGFLPFDQECKTEDFDWLLSFGDIKRLMPVLTAGFGEFLEEVTEGKKQAAQGAADRKRAKTTKGR